MVSLVNTHTNATRIGWHLWEIDLRFAPGLPPGWPRFENAETPQDASSEEIPQDVYRGTSLIRNGAPLGPYSRNVPRALWWSQGGALFLMCEVPM